jgi:hypothetical protein
MHRLRHDAMCPFDVREVCSLQHLDNSLANGDFGIYASLNEATAMKNGVTSSTFCDYNDDRKPLGASARHGFPRHCGAQDEVTGGPGEGG